MLWRLSTLKEWKLEIMTWTGNKVSHGVLLHAFDIRFVLTSVHIEDLSAQLQNVITLTVLRFFEEIKSIE